ncbi:hypothetical protein [Paenibacillus herberti]|uniref:hypothetical protein n=1 Tax=Paenibacillus herberti TaxID=1619309 RepID=UPI001595908B|nr:hypothetical protein [Paenibacillus herberti]
MRVKWVGKHNSGRNDVKPGTIGSITAARRRATREAAGRIKAENKGRNLQESGRRR